MSILCYMHDDLITQSQHNNTIVNGVSRIGYMGGGESALWVDEDFHKIFTEKSVDLIRENKDQPFFLFVSFPDPHHPFNPPGKYWDMYGPDQFEVGLPFGAHRNPTPPMRWLDDQRKNAGGQMTPQTAMMLDDQRLLTLPAFGEVTTTAPFFLRDAAPVVGSLRLAAGDRR